MAGARYGTVVRVGREKVHVTLDAMPGVHAITPGMLRPGGGVVTLPAAPANQSQRDTRAPRQSWRTGGALGVPLAGRAR